VRYPVGTLLRYRRNNDLILEVVGYQPYGLHEYYECRVFDRREGRWDKNGAYWEGALRRANQKTAQAEIMIAMLGR
jgi:hypothetical protein